MKKINAWVPILDWNLPEFPYLYMYFQTEQ